MVEYVEARLCWRCPACLREDLVVDVVKQRHGIVRAGLGVLVVVVLGCSVVGWRMWQAQRQREAHAIQWPTVNSVALPRTWRQDRQ